MKVIYKHHLKDERNEIFLPEGSVPLTAQAQQGKIMVWVRQDKDSNSSVIHRFIVVGTGQGEVGDEWEYLSTVQINGGSLIYHVFHMIYQG